MNFDLQKILKTSVSFKEHRIRQVEEDDSSRVKMKRHTHSHKNSHAKLIVEIEEESKDGEDAFAQSAAFGSHRFEQEKDDSFFHKTSEPSISFSRSGDEHLFA